LTISLSTWMTDTQHSANQFLSFLWLKETLFLHSLWPSSCITAPMATRHVLPLKHYIH
jgi:hypothetical protein